LRQGCPLWVKSCRAVRRVSSRSLRAITQRQRSLTVRDSRHSRRSVSNGNSRKAGRSPNSMLWLPCEYFRNLSSTSFHISIATQTRMSRHTVASNVEYRPLRRRERGSQAHRMRLKLRRHVAFSNGTRVYVHEFLRDDPSSVVQKILLRMVELSRSEVIRIPIGPDYSREKSSLLCSAHQAL